MPWTRSFWVDTGGCEGLGLRVWSAYFWRLLRSFNPSPTKTLYPNRQSTELIAVKPQGALLGWKHRKSQKPFWRPSFLIIYVHQCSKGFSRHAQGDTLWLPPRGKYLLPMSMKTSNTRAGAPAVFVLINIFNVATLLSACKFIHGKGRLIHCKKIRRCLQRVDALGSKADLPHKSSHVSNVDLGMRGMLRHMLMTRFSPP